MSLKETSPLVFLAPVNYSAREKHSGSSCHLKIYSVLKDNSIQCKKSGAQNLNHVSSFPVVNTGRRLICLLISKFLCFWELECLPVTIKCQKGRECTLKKYIQQVHCRVKNRLKKQNKTKKSRNIYLMIVKSRFRNHPPKYCGNSQHV